MSIDNPVKPLSAEVIAEDLSLSNEEGTSWYGYAPGESEDTIRVEQYGETGEIVARYVVTLSIEEITE